jgi:hypothetical protein
MKRKLLKFDDVLMGGRGSLSFVEMLDEILIRVVED